MKEGIGACLIDKPEFIADVVRQNIPMQFTDDVGHRSSDEDYVIAKVRQTRARISDTSFSVSVKIRVHSDIK